MSTRRTASVAISVILLSLLTAIGAGVLWKRLSRDPLTELALAIGTDSDIEPRLTGGFFPRSENARRSATPVPERLSPDARIALARLEKATATADDPRARAALGVAYLVGGNVDLAIATLDDATSLADSAESWNDLSAAYLVKAERAPERRVELLARALRAAERSLRVRVSNEAHFNRALTVHRLAPFLGDVNPWADYLRLERDPNWAAAARRYTVTPVKAPDGGSWDDRRRLLKERIGAQPQAFLVETASRFPEGTQEFIEQDLLIEWARAVTAGQAKAAADSLARAEALAGAWSTATGDPMLHETIGVIRSAAASPERSRGLARAHLAYRDVINQYRSDQYDAAAASAQVALDGFSRGQSPFWAWAALQKAIILFQRRQRDDADATLAPVEALARRRGYRTLLGRTLRQRGLNQSKLWRIDEALRLFEEAASCFEEARQRESAAVVDSQIADMLRTLGEQQASWDFIGKALDGLPQMRMPLQRYLALFNASLFASSQDLLDAALLFQNAALREANLRGGGPVVEALIQRATILSRRGNDDQALQDLQAAAVKLRELQEGPLKRYHQAEIDVLSAELSQSGRVALEADALQRAISFFSDAEPGQLPRLHLALARSSLRARKEVDAERAFEQGIARLEQQQVRLGDEAFKISYFDDSWSLFPEMIQFQMDVRHDVDRAFAYAERSRARSLLVTAPAEAQTTTLSAAQRAMPDSVVLLNYVVLSDRLLTWTITSRGHELIQTDVARDQLRRLAARFRSDVKDRPTQPSVAGERLWDLMIRQPTAALAKDTTLAFAVDGDLQQIPFAALKSPSSGRYLIEDHGIVVSPSATFFIAGLAHSRELASKPLTSALLIGDPTSGARSAGLARLAGAESEAIATAAAYPRPLVLTGRAATKERFVEAAPAFDVVHFGGHALVNPEYPLMSRLLFAPLSESGSEESLFAREISQLPLKKTRLVVLAACSTAAGAISRGEGVVSVARPFLAAGVPVVIASQWDVDDRATEQLFVAFHRALAESRDSVAALRVAQLSLLHGANSSFAVPGNWSAFVALGTVAR